MRRVCTEVSVDCCVGCGPLSVTSLTLLGGLVIPGVSVESTLEQPRLTPASGVASASAATQHTEQPTDSSSPHGDGEDGLQLLPGLVAQASATELPASDAEVELVQQEQEKEQPTSRKRAQSDDVRPKDTGRTPAQRRPRLRRQRAEAHTSGRRMPTASPNPLKRQKPCHNKDQHPPESLRATHKTKIMCSFLHNSALYAGRGQAPHRQATPVTPAAANNGRQAPPIATPRARRPPTASLATSQRQEALPTTPQRGQIAPPPAPLSCTENQPEPPASYSASMADFSRPRWRPDSSASSATVVYREPISTAWAYTASMADFSQPRWRQPNRLDAAPRHVVGDRQIGAHSRRDQVAPPPAPQAGSVSQPVPPEPAPADPSRGRWRLPVEAAYEIPEVAAPIENIQPVSSQINVTATAGKSVTIPKCPTPEHIVLVPSCSGLHSKKEEPKVW
ncbi:serine/arginine repetitive matrix protein 1-like [Schistocerca serialis cubense]|uniref:serine/arginine repetitive matrix protein 1-like n=1 Tax=Schistocerca serialis cubense TaxID=2023355 RepID=UPI00214E0073|nr:serine/arginine repetitive matrix protein 1-like [Schistocerca serialis cubense]